MADWSIVATSEMSEDLRWDAEYYRSAFLRQAKAISRMPHRQLGEVATISDGNHLSIAEEFCQSGVRYLRGQDLSDFFISDADPIYIPEKVYNALARSHMLPGDVLLSIVGTIGSVGLVTERHGKLTGNCKLAIVRAKELPAEYIAAYLASRAGQNEIQRRIRGAVQMGLILPDLKKIPIPLASDSVRNRIVGIIKGAQVARHRAANCVCQAEDLLASSLGLDNLDHSLGLCYERPFADLLAAGRFDAGFFNPRYQRVLQILSKGGLTIAHVALLPERRFAPELQTKGSQFQYIEIGSLTADGEATAERIYVADAPSRAQWIVQPGDVITSTVRPIRRLSALIGDDQRDYVCSSGFAVLHPKAGKDTIEPEVLLAYLRLPIVCEIMDLQTTASMYPAIPIDRLLKIPIRLPSARVRAQVVEKIRTAFAARRETVTLLEKAKKAVEGLFLGRGYVERN